LLHDHIITIYSHMVQASWNSADMTWSGRLWPMLPPIVLGRPAATCHERGGSNASDRTMLGDL
jgi:hypothetical protein